MTSEAITTQKQEESPKPITYIEHIDSLRDIEKRALEIYNTVFSSGRFNSNLSGDFDFANLDRVAKLLEEFDKIMQSGKFTTDYIENVTDLRLYHIDQIAQFAAELSNSVLGNSVQTNLSTKMIDENIEITLKRIPNLEEVSKTYEIINKYFNTYTKASILFKVSLEKKDQFGVRRIYTIASILDIQKGNLSSLKELKADQQTKKSA